MARKSLHVVMVPWLAFGHMIPFSHLSVSLARLGVRVSYISTPRNLQRLPQLPSTMSDLIKHISLPLPRVDGLPDGAEATTDVTFEQVQYLKASYDLLSQEVDQIIATQSPDWIITDFAAHWIVSIAEKHEIPLMFFSIFGAAFDAFIGPPVDEAYMKLRPTTPQRLTPQGLTSKPEWMPLGSTLAFRRHEAEKFVSGMEYGLNASGVTDVERWGTVLRGCKAITIRSCKEFEGEYIDLLENLYQKPVIPAGVLPSPEASTDSEDKELDGEWKEVFKWLDEKMAKSVVYVAFGSEYQLTKEEVHEIAYGLELSELPFLWVLRKPKWAGEDSDAMLPSGFNERTRDRGIINSGWAPQQKILAHESIGGSLIHCGWGSIMETLRYGKIAVGLPFVIDQGLNARLLLEKDVGVEVERREDGSFGREQVAKELRRAMVDEEGEKTRVCARKAGMVFGDEKLQLETYVGGLVKYLTRTTK